MDSRNYSSAKDVSEFTGLSKRSLKEKFREYINKEWRYIILSYIFIILSSSLPIISWRNGSIYVIVWFTISNILTLLNYLWQCDRVHRRNKASHYKKRHKKIHVDMGVNVKAEIDTWDIIGIQFSVACLFAAVLILLSSFQFADYKKYIEEYKDLYWGIVTDTYIVVVFSIAFQLFVEHVCNLIENKRKSINFHISIEAKEVLRFIIGAFFAFVALIYYFNNEFAGLVGNITVRRVLGGLYILFMTYPGIKQIFHALKQK